jgi:hypothetical protein
MIRLLRCRRRAQRRKHKGSIWIGNGETREVSRPLCRCNRCRPDRSSRGVCYGPHNASETLSLRRQGRKQNSQEASWKDGFQGVPHGLKILRVRTNDIASARCTAISCGSDARQTTSIQPPRGLSQSADQLSTARENDAAQNKCQTRNPERCFQ